MIETLRQAPPPHVLGLPECTYYEADHQAGLWSAVAALNSLWEGRDVYLPFLSSRIGSRNTPGLFVAASAVRPIRWHRGDAPHTRKLLWNVLEVEVGSARVFVKVEHWNGSEGAESFAMQSALAGQLASKPTVLLGDFNATSSDPRETVPVDWAATCREAGTPWKVRQKGVRAVDGRWVVNTAPMDDLLTDGFWDAGAEADDFSVTSADGDSSMRIDRILVSRRFNAALVPDSYRVLPGRKSDHHYVTCELGVA